MRKRLNKLYDKLRIVLFAVFLILFHTSHAQRIHFQQTYGSSLSDRGKSIAKSGETFYLAGETNGFGGITQDIIVSQIDSLGNILWSKTLGTIENIESPSEIKIDKNGNLLVAGNSVNSTGTDQDFYLTKLDSTGQLIWEVKVGGSSFESLNDLVITDSNSYILVGYSTSYSLGLADAYIVKISENGTVQWGRNYGNFQYEDAQSICTSYDGNYWVTGQTLTYGSGNGDGYLMKINELGDPISFSTFGTNGVEAGTNVIELADSSVFVAGTKVDSTINPHVVGMFKNAMLVHFDSLGTYDWAKTYGGLHDEEVEFMDYRDTTLYLGGYLSSADASEVDGWLLQTTLNGDTLANRFFGKDSLNDKHSGDIEYLSDLIFPSDSGVVLAGSAQGFGSSDWQLYLIRTNEELRTDCFMTQHPIFTSSTNLQQLSFSVTNGNGFSLDTLTYNEDAVTLNFDTICFFHNPLPKDSTDTTGVSSIFLNAGLEVLVSPNPFQNHIKIKLLDKKGTVSSGNQFSYRLINAQGQLLQSGKLENPILDMASFSAGVYILQIQNPKGLSISNLILKE